MEKRWRNRLLAAYGGSLVVLIAGFLLTRGFIFDPTAGKSAATARLTNQLTSELDRFVATGRHFLRTGSVGERELLSAREIQVETTLVELAGRTRDSEQADAPMVNLRQSVDEIVAIVGRFTQEYSSEADANEESVMGMDDELDEYESDYRDRLAVVVRVLQADLDREVDRSTARRAGTRWIVIGIGLFVFVCGLLLAFSTIRELGIALNKNDEPKATRIAVVIKQGVRIQLRGLIEHAAAIRRETLSAADNTRVLEIAEIATSIDRQLEDVFDLTRIEHGQASIQHERCGVDQLLELAVEPNREVARSRGVRLRSESVASVVCVDRQRIARVLRTLLGTVLSSAGAGAQVHVAAVNVDEGVRFSITSLGSGALPESLASLFGAPADKAADDKHDTADLLLSRRLIEEHGARLEFERSRSRATWWFLIPNAPTLGDAAAGNFATAP